MTSGEAFEPAMTRATSPGTTLSRKKVSVAVATRVTADQRRRFMNRVIMLSHGVEPHPLKAKIHHGMKVNPVQPRRPQRINVLVKEKGPGCVLHHDPFRGLVDAKPLFHVFARRSFRK